METLENSVVDLDSLGLLRKDLEERVINSDYKTTHYRTSSCLNTDILKLRWPKLQPEEIRHLNGCEYCQRLVKNWPRTLPVLYLGPSEIFFCIAKKEDAGLEEFLDKWLKTSTKKCIYNGGFFLNIPSESLEHADKCQHCQELIQKICLHESTLAGDFLSFFTFPEFNYLKKELSEVKEKACLGEGHGSSQWTNNLRQCHKNCFNPIEVGKDQVVFLPRKKELTEHHRNCPHCQLILQYHFLQSNRDFLTPDCLDAKGWRNFPIFYPEDQKYIKKHITNCDKCRQLVSDRVYINFVQDKELFSKFAKQSESFLSLKEMKRQVQRYVGDWIFSYKFHFGPDGPFSQRHPWSIWNNEDRMLKLLWPTDLLSEEELFYLDVLQIGKDHDTLDLDIIKAIEKIFFRNVSH